MQSKPFKETKAKFALRFLGQDMTANRETLHSQHNVKGLNTSASGVS